MVNPCQQRNESLLTRPSATIEGVAKDFLPAEAEKIRAFLRRVKTEDKLDGVKIGKKIKRSGPAVTQILSGKNTPSLRTARAIAALRGLTIWQLLDEDAASPQSVSRDRYPHRAIAVRIARIDGLSEEAIARAEEFTLEGETADLGVCEWLDVIRTEDLRQRTRVVRPPPALTAAPDRKP